MPSTLNNGDYAICRGRWVGSKTIKYVKLAEALAVHGSVRLWTAERRLPQKHVTTQLKRWICSGSEFRTGSHFPSFSSGRGKNQGFASLGSCPHQAHFRPLDCGYENLASTLRRNLDILFCPPSSECWQKEWVFRTHGGVEKHLLMCGARGNSRIHRI